MTIKRGRSQRSKLGEGGKRKEERSVVEEGLQKKQRNRAEARQ